MIFILDTFEYENNISSNVNLEVLALCDKINIFKILKVVYNTLKVVQLEGGHKGHSCYQRYLGAEAGGLLDLRKLA